jgi:hypothetical protein
MADFPTVLSNVADNTDDVMAKYVNNIEALLGINGSDVTTSHSYKLSGVTSSDKAASLTGTETLTNKRLTSPKINEDVTLAATATKIDAVCNTYIPWTAYIPTLTAAGGTVPTYTGDAVTGRYCQIGKMVTLQFYFGNGGGGTPGAGAVNLFFSLPVEAADTSVYDWTIPVGTAFVLNGTTTACHTCQIVNSTHGKFLLDSSGILKASGQSEDSRILAASITYEAA